MGDDGSVSLATADGTAMISVMNGRQVAIAGDVAVSGNLLTAIAPGAQLLAWIADVVAKLTAAGFAPIAPLPTSLTQ